MSSPNGAAEDRPAAQPGDAGATTAPKGTPHPIDFSQDRRSRIVWVLLLAGPVVWFAHFMLVYLVVEAGCTSGGPGLRLFDPPVTTIVTLAATGAAAAACLGLARWTYRRWRGDLAGPDRGLSEEPPPAPGEPNSYQAIAMGGFLLSLLSFVTILFVGLPALVLQGC
jgi:hypothetical protein